MKNNGKRQMSTSRFLSLIKADITPTLDAPTTIAYRGIAQQPTHASAVMNIAIFDLWVFIKSS
jgi:hypothetical protein